MSLIDVRCDALMGTHRCLDGAVQQVDDQGVTSLVASESPNCVTPCRRLAMGTEIC